MIINASSFSDQVTRRRVVWQRPFFDQTQSYFASEVGGQSLPGFAGAL